MEDGRHPTERIFIVLVPEVSHVPEEEFILLENDLAPLNIP